MTPVTTASTPVAVLTSYSMNLLRTELYRLHGNDVDLRVRLSLDVPGLGLASYYRSHQDLGLPNTVVSSDKLLRLLREMPDGTNKNDVFPKLEDARSAGRLRAFPQNDVAFLQPLDTVILDGVSGTVRHIFDVHCELLDFAPWSLKLARKGKPTGVELADHRCAPLDRLEVTHRLVFNQHVADIIMLRRLRVQVVRELKSHTKAVLSNPELAPIHVDGMMAANRSLSAIEALLIQESGHRSNCKTSPEQRERRNVRLRMRSLKRELAAREQLSLSTVVPGGEIFSKMLATDLEGCLIWRKWSPSGRRVVWQILSSRANGAK